MAFTLPLPVRVAAGILATGIDRVRSLPDDIPALPVTLVGNAMRLTMKVQQEIATLATRGDELLGGVIAAPQENPSWARFDDDEPTPFGTGRVTPSTVRAAPTRLPDAPAGTGGKSGSGKPKKPNNVIPKVHPRPADGSGSDGSEPASERVTSATETVRVDGSGADAAYAIDDAVSTDPAATDTGTIDPVTAQTATTDTATTDTATTGTATNGAATNGAGSAGSANSETATLTTPDATSMAPISTTAMDAAIDVAEALVELATEANEPPSSAGATPTVTLDTAVDVAELDLTDAAPDTVVFDETEGLTEHIAVPAGLREEVEEASDGPAALPGYDLMTLAQVRGHLRDLSADDVTALLDYERLADNRAPFLTLLSNRLVTLDAKHP